MTDFLDHPSCTCSNILYMFSSLRKCSSESKGVIRAPNSTELNSTQPVGRSDHCLSWSYHQWVEFSWRTVVSCQAKLPFFCWMIC